MVFRKRAKDEEEPSRRAFDVVAALVDHAQRTLIAAVPTARDPGVPLRDALDAFLRALDEIDDAMPAWRDERVAHEWTMCRDGITEARASARRLLALNIELTFEQLNAQIGDVLYPLEAFVDAERSMRRR
jgi:hypothetical protein